jgi:CheY-like chemotaxis protein
MDGFESTSRFRAWEKEQQDKATAAGQTPKARFLIVGMSANSDAQSKQNALDAGMDAFCPKPFNYKELEAVLATRMPKRASLRVPSSAPSQASSTRLPE